MVYPGPLPAATFTPFPSPTLRPGPTDTPLPLAPAAQDASGVIRYLAAGDAGSASLVSLPVDALGTAKRAPEQIKLIDKIPVDQVIYPSPDGHYLGLLSYWEGGFSGILIDTTIGEAFPFSEIANQENFYSWFPDNRHILVRANYGSLWSVDPFTGDYVALAVPDFGGIYGGAVSPDGKRVVYSYFRGVDSPYTQIRIVNSDGRDDHLLLETNSPPAYFAWSPDGKKIAFLKDGWIVVDIDGSNLRQLIHLGPPGCHINPISWSPDSRRLIIVSTTERLPCTDWEGKQFKSNDIYIVDVESGEVHPLLEDGILGNYDPGLVAGWQADRLCLHPQRRLGAVGCQRRRQRPAPDDQHRAAGAIPVLEQPIVVG